MTTDYANVIVPPDDYDHEFVPGAVKRAVKASEAKSNDLYMVPLDNLVIDERFNVRIWDAGREEQVEWIKDSIIANGFYTNKPLSGYAGRLDGNDVIYLTGGFTRFEAAKRVRKEGGVLERVPVVLAPSGTNMVDLTVALDVENTGTPLRPYERAIVAKRLRSLGLDEREIGSRLRYSTGYIRNLLYLISLPRDLRNLVIQGKVKANWCIQKARELGPEAALEMFQTELADDEEDDKPIGGETVLEEEMREGAEGRDRPAIQNRRKTPKRPGNITAKTVLFAVDHAIELMDTYDPESGYEWLLNWRKGDKNTVAELEDLMKAARKKAREANKPPADTTSKPTIVEPVHPPTEEEAQAEGMAAMCRAAGPAPHVEDDGEDEPDPLETDDPDDL